jgi:hypothetical protein
VVLATTSVTVIVDGTICMEVAGFRVRLHTDSTGRKPSVKTLGPRSIGMRQAPADQFSPGPFPRRLRLASLTAFSMVGRVS